MNIFEAAREAFSQGKAIGRKMFVDVTIQQDDEVGFLVVVLDDGTCYVGWNPSAEELIWDDWRVTERREIRKRVYCEHQ